MDIYVADLHAKFGSNQLKIKKVTANNVNGVQVWGQPTLLGTHRPLEKVHSLC